MPALFLVVAACWALTLARRATSRRRMYSELNAILGR